MGYGHIKLLAGLTIILREFWGYNPFSYSIIGCKFVAVRKQGTFDW